MNPVKLGDKVIYVQKVDTDPSEASPNICLALVVKVNADGQKADLFCMHSMGTFSQLQVSQSADPVERGTFHYPV